MVQPMNFCVTSLHSSACPSPAVKQFGDMPLPEHIPGSLTVMGDMDRLILAKRMWVIA
jgi:hypothetical protein